MPPNYCPALPCPALPRLQGGWVFLDNLHLMSGWIPTLERKLEAAAEGAPPDFRFFFSAEPIAGAPQARIIPESILQASQREWVGGVTREGPGRGPEEAQRMHGLLPAAAADQHLTTLPVM